jgi:hypothetical protein
MVVLPMLSQLVSGTVSSGGLERQSALTAARVVRICGMLPLMVFIRYAPLSCAGAGMGMRKVCEKDARSENGVREEEGEKVREGR